MDLTEAAIDIFQATLAFLTALMLYYSLRIAKETAAHEITMQCQERFCKLLESAEEKKSGGRMTHENTKSCCELYWHLQIDQFQYWKKGYIKDDTYRWWMKCRRNEWENNEKIGDISYRDGWNHAKTKLRPPSEFIKFIELIFKGKIDNAFSMKKWMSTPPLLRTITLRIRRIVDD